MVKTVRDGLFVAYSRRNCDWRWRDRFVKHLKSVVSDSELFVDRTSIQGGIDWELSIENAVKRAAQTLRGMQWFEVTDTRGHIEDGKVAWWQVTIKVGFTLEE